MGTFFANFKNNSGLFSFTILPTHITLKLGVPLLFDTFFDSGYKFFINLVIEISLRKRISLYI